MLKQFGDQGDWRIYCEAKKFIATVKPQFSTPYLAVWDHFAKQHNLNEFDRNQVDDDFVKLFKKRVTEKWFDFNKILKCIAERRFYLGGKDGDGWKVSFRWIIENEEKVKKLIG